MLADASVNVLPYRVGPACMLAAAGDGQKNLEGVGSIFWFWWQIDHVVCLFSALP